MIRATFEKWRKNVFQSSMVTVKIFWNCKASLGLPISFALIWGCVPKITNATWPRHVYKILFWEQYCIVYLETVVIGIDHRTCEIWFKCSFEEKLRMNAKMEFNARGVFCAFSLYKSIPENPSECLNQWEREREVWLDCCELLIRSRFLISIAYE